MLMLLRKELGVKGRFKRIRIGTKLLLCAAHPSVWGRRTSRLLLVLWCTVVVHYTKHFGLVSSATASVVHRRRWLVVGVAVMQRMLKQVLLLLRLLQLLVVMIVTAAVVVIVMMVIVMIVSIFERLAVDKVW